jgi:hypothetical protein
LDIILLGAAFLRQRPTTQSRADGHTTALTINEPIIGLIATSKWQIF